MYQQTRLRRCAYANRGCTTTLRQENLSSHLKKCGFAPIQCIFDGCEVTVNRQDANSHHENCEFRWVTCEECDEAMKKSDYEEHVCVLRKKLAEMTKIVQAVQGDQVSTILHVISHLAHFNLSCQKSYNKASCLLLDSTPWCAWFFVSVLRSSCYPSVPFISQDY